MKHKVTLDAAGKISQELLLSGRYFYVSECKGDFEFLAHDRSGSVINTSNWVDLGTPEKFGGNYNIQVKNVSGVENTVVIESSTVKIGRSKLTEILGELDVKVVNVNNEAIPIKSANNQPLPVLVKNDNAAVLTPIVLEIPGAAPFQVQHNLNNVKALDIRADASINIGGVPIGSGIKMGKMETQLITFTGDAGDKVYILEYK